MRFNSVVRCGILASLPLAFLASAMASGPREPEDPGVKRAASIRYKTRTLEMAGIVWREAMGAKLQPLQKAPSFAVWKVDEATLADLIKRAAEVGPASEEGHREGEAVLFTDQKKFEYVSGGVWVLNDDGAMIFARKMGELEYGLRLSMEGRLVEGSVRLKAAVEDVHFMGLTSISIKRPSEPDGEDVAQIFRPELKLLNQKGEWSLPHEGALVISLGARHQVAENGPTFEEYPAWARAMLDISVELMLEFRCIDRSSLDWIVEQQAAREYQNAPIRERLVVVEARPVAEKVADQAGGSAALRR